MGTFLGNLQVYGAPLAEVSALLPKAAVGQWSERFVTVLAPDFGLGSVDRPARALSKKLPQTAVLSVGLADSDLLELAVWQDGRRLTVRAHMPYDGVPKRGDPKVFCRAFGLPPEDEKRLKAVWAKGDAEEQLELTGCLLGAPLWCEAEYPPEEQAVRDAARVDRWLAQHPDPPRVKNQTRAEEIQFLPGYTARWDTSVHGGALQGIWCQRPREGGGCRPEEDVVFRPGPSGCLEEWAECRKIAKFRTDLKHTGGRVFALWLHLENGWSGTEGSYSMLLADSWNVLPCPFRFALDGRDRECQVFWSMEDGGLIGWVHSCGIFDEDWKILDPDELVCYAPDGGVRWRRPLNEGKRSGYPEILHNNTMWLKSDMGWVGLDPADGRECTRIPEEPGIELELLDCPSEPGELWAVRSWFEREKRSTEYRLLRLDRNGKVLQRGSLPAHLSRSLGGLVFLRDRILFYSFDEGLWLLDRNTLSVLKGMADHRTYVDAVPDSLGRIWVQVGDSTMEAYDQDLKLLSRHRLKGSIMGRYLDDQGRLCAVTYSESKGKNDVRFDDEGNLYFPGFDKNKEIVRVYRLS